MATNTASAVRRLLAWLRYWARLLRALVADPRLPRPLRVLIAASLTIKAIPGPDLGLDEIGLGLALLLLLTRYRAVFRQLRAEAALAPEAA